MIPRLNRTLIIGLAGVGFAALGFTLTLVAEWPPAQTLGWPGASLAIIGDALEVWALLRAIRYRRCVVRPVGPEPTARYGVYISSAANIAADIQRLRELDDLIVSLLSPLNRARYERRLPIYVLGSAGGRYAIRPGFMATVERLSPKPAHLCAYPVMGRDASAGWLGSAARERISLLAQMLKITTDEPGYLDVAREYR